MLKNTLNKFTPKNGVSGRTNNSTLRTINEGQIGHTDHKTKPSNDFTVVV